MQGPGCSATALSAGQPPEQARLTEGGAKGGRLLRPEGKPTVLTWLLWGAKAAKAGGLRSLHSTTARHAVLPGLPVQAATCLGLRLNAAGSQRWSGMAREPARPWVLLCLQGWRGLSAQHLLVLRACPVMGHAGAAGAVHCQAGPPGCTTSAAGARQHEHWSCERARLAILAPAAAAAAWTRRIHRLPERWPRQSPREPARWLPQSRCCQRRRLAALPRPAHATQQSVRCAQPGCTAMLAASGL